MKDLSLHILDIVENSIDAGATRIEIRIDENIKKNLLVLKIIDNGKGMDQKTLRKVLDPFYTTKKTRKVGLGLSMLAQATKEAAGNIEIKSAKGKGTNVLARFTYDHIDRKPIGDMAETIYNLIATNGLDIDFVYEHKKNGKGFVFDTKPMRRRLKNVPINNPEILAILRKGICNGLNKIKKERRKK